MSDEIAALLEQVRPLHDAVASHEAYRRLDNLSNVRSFMEVHVFAVWDFMTLLSAIRARLTSVAVPWSVSGTAEGRRYVNELFLVEDADEHPTDDRFTSHFELYLEAMAAAGADTTPIDRFCAALASGTSLEPALEACEAPQGAIEFTAFTWSLVEAGSIGELLGAFTFGREALIPEMFARVRSLATEVPQLELFRAYVARHIEIDGGDHAPVAFRLIDSVCADGSASWNQVAQGAIGSLNARKQMWDSMTVSSKAAVR